MRSNHLINVLFICRIPVDLRPVTYYTAIRNGGERVWDFMWEQYKNSNVVSDEMTLLNSLTRTKKMWLLQR